MTYTNFESKYDTYDENDNLLFYIDGYADNIDEGKTIAVIILTPHNDICIDWHENGYRLNETVLKLINDTINTKINNVIEQRNLQIKENKAIFIKDLHKLLSSETSEYSDIERMDYVVIDQNEYLYVTYKSHSQKRININMDSCSGILDDFCRQLHSTSWLLSDKKLDFDKE